VYCGCDDFVLVVGCCGGVVVVGVYYLYGE